MLNNLTTIGFNFPSSNSESVSVNPIPSFIAFSVDIPCTFSELNGIVKFSGLTIIDLLDISFPV